MSVGYSLYYYRNTRNPLIKRFLSLGAIDASSSITIEAVLETPKVTETVINQFIKANHVIKSEEGKLFLNVAKIKHDALYYGLFLLVLSEFIIVFILLLTVFVPTVVEIPLIVQVLVFIIGNIIIGVLTYLEAWPYFHLNIVLDKVS